MTAALWLFVGLIGVGLVVFSQIWAFVWDEGFHLVAAQLIKDGRTPYLDFCFPQTPLNAYLNAGLMWLFGEDWHPPQLAAALATAAATALTADFVLRRFPEVRWRLAGAFLAAGFVGLNSTLLQYGTVAQAYGVSTFFSVAAFRTGIVAVRKCGLVLGFATGLLAATAAGCTLLTAPVWPVLLIWMIIYSDSGERLKNGLAFVVGSIVPFIPVIVLWVRSPSIVFFNIVQYQAIFRRYHWNGATEHDIEVLSGWLESTPMLLLLGLTITGWFVLIRDRDWERREKSELYLAGAIGTALAVYIATAHPTFERYFVFALPFLGIMAVVGLYLAGTKLAGKDRPLWPTVIVVGLLLAALARGLYMDRDSMRWSDYRNIANKVARVTPRQATLYADELVYFLLGWTPPPAMEFSYSHKLELSPAEEAKYHIISERELNEQVKAGRFATVQSCNDDRIDEMKLPQLFEHKEEVGDCSIFWGFKGAPSNSKQ